ncbi:hypothetical protein Mapa_012211 [Marchantia paleacea]|nr:hypothetical protein Mapa_012211 [Marchantia paleacea]
MEEEHYHAMQGVDHIPHKRQRSHLICTPCERDLNIIRLKARYTFYTVPLKLNISQRTIHLVIFRNSDLIRSSLDGDRSFCCSFLLSTYLINKQHRDKLS